LLLFGVAVSLIDSVALYKAAAREGVLHINQGIGLLNNYGLFSTILGNAIALYVAKKYYDCVCSIKTSKAVVTKSSVRESLEDLKSMIEMRGVYQASIYLLVGVGAAFWVENFKSHVSGNPEIVWGQKVFDSPDHLLTFWASRVHNLYTWLFIMPLVVNVMIWSSVQLRRAMAAASKKGALKYDLLYPDQRGGFGFVDRAHIAFNVVVALVYIQVTMHMVTFGKINSDHKLDLFALTLLLLVINRIFLSHIYRTINKLRVKSLNKMKDKVYKDDKLSFEILKYCYERRISASSVVNFAVKAGAILVPGVVKFWPAIAKALSRA
jgi:hypothetical protein